MVQHRYPEHALFIESAERFREEVLDPYVDEWEDLGYFPDNVFKSFADQGFLGMLLPEEYGGVGGDYRLAASWCEVFGEVRSTGLVVALAMHALVITHAIARYGSESTKKRILPPSMSGDLIGAYAFTEPGAGSDLANIRTKAELKNGKWILNGTKIFITNGARSHYVLVLARTDPTAGYKGFTTFVVDTSSPGFTVNRTLDKLGWLSSDTAELFFDNVEVDPVDVLGEVGAGWTQASNNLSWERLMLSLVTLGGMRAAYRELSNYCADRVVFGSKLNELQVVERDLASMRAKIRFAEGITSRSLSGLEKGDNIRALAAITKRLVAKDALWLADRSIQLHGGYGYTKEFPAERWWRDLRLMPIGGGTDEIMANIVRKDHGW